MRDLIHGQPSAPQCKWCDNPPATGNDVCAVCLARNKKMSHDFAQPVAQGSELVKPDLDPVELRNPFEPHSWGFDIWHSGYIVGRSASIHEFINHEANHKLATDKINDLIAENNEYFDKLHNAESLLSSSESRVRELEARNGALTKTLHTVIKCDACIACATVARAALARAALAGRIG